MLGLAEVRRALAEDRAGEDVTTKLLGRVTSSTALARFVAESAFVVAGIPVVETVFHELEPAATLGDRVPDGTWCKAGQSLLTVRASVATLLSGERVALNFLQRLSGIATVTRRCVDAVAGTGAAITHTRKTTPGLRDLERYAVRVGGGVDNRGSLAEAVFWKDNHWSLLSAGHLTLRDALAKAPGEIPVIVEVENEAQLDEARSAGVTHVLADNQPPEQIREWVKRCGPSVLIQASGGITPESVRAYAEAGAKLISMGMLTHSAAAMSISCEISVPD